MATSKADLSRYHTDPEYRSRMLELQAKYRERNRERIRVKAKEHRLKNRENIYKADLKWRHDNPHKQLLILARNRARRLDVPFNLTADDVVIPDLCPVLGIKIICSIGGPRRKGFLPESPSIDRIVPELGYVKGNVSVISMRANRLKNDATLEEIESIAAYIRRETQGT